MNMRVLKRSRKKPKDGDIFVYQVMDHDFGFGRVIDTSETGGPQSILVYLYNTFLPNKQNIPELSQHRLLIPPLFVMPWPWRDGYFETIQSGVLDPHDLLPVHCFEKKIFRRMHYVDERDRELPQRVEPCGFWGIASTGYVDIVVSRALGLPPHPDTLFTADDFKKSR
ncbi:MAG: hypothetical protein AMXMBFR47_15890 [Planctomycetota bacterium]